MRVPCERTANKDGSMGIAAAAPARTNNSPDLRKEVKPADAHRGRRKGKRGRGKAYESEEITTKAEGIGRKDEVDANGIHVHDA